MDSSGIVALAITAMFGGAVMYGIYEVNKNIEDEFKHEDSPGKQVKYKTENTGTEPGEWDKCDPQNFDGKQRTDAMLVKKVILSSPKDNSEAELESALKAIEECTAKGTPDLHHFISNCFEGKDIKSIVKEQLDKFRTPAPTHTDSSTETDVEPDEKPLPPKHTDSSTETDVEPDDDAVNAHTNLTREVLISSNHNLVNNSDLGMINLICPVNRTDHAQRVGENITAMNVDNILTLSFFLPSRDASKYATGKYSEHLNKYIIPQIICSLIAAHLKLGVRLYLDSCSYKFLSTILVPGVTLEALFPNTHTVNLLDHTVEQKYIQLAEVIRAKVSKLQQFWDNLVEMRASVADAMCICFWHCTTTLQSEDFMNATTRDYMRSWNHGAQVFTVDISNVRPDWYKQISLNGIYHKFLIHNGYLASVYRLFVMRQDGCISEEIDDTSVNIPVPKSIHIRDAHATIPSFGDIDHIDMFMKSQYTYEWVFIPTKYIVSWASVTKKALHTPICCYVNAKLTGENKCIMPDEDYQYSIGLIWDDNILEKIGSVRGYDGRKPVPIPSIFAYGIDELLLTVGTGVPNKIRSLLQYDPFAECFNAIEDCGPFNSSNKKLSQEDVNESDISRMSAREPNLIMDKSAIFPIMFAWARSSEWTIVWQPDEVVAFKISYEQTPECLFFATKNNLWHGWTPKTDACETPQEYTQVGGDGNIFATKDVGNAVMCLVFKCNSEEWSATGYQNAAQLFAEFADIDLLFEQHGEYIITSYNNYDMGPGMKPFDMLPSDMEVLNVIKKCVCIEFKAYTACQHVGGNNA